MFYIPFHCLSSSMEKCFNQNKSYDCNDQYCKVNYEKMEKSKKWGLKCCQDLLRDEEVENRNDTDQPLILHRLIGIMKYN